jgi:hypothetical protein
MRPWRWGTDDDLMSSLLAFELVKDLESLGIAALAFAALFLVLKGLEQV